MTEDGEKRKHQPIPQTRVQFFCSGCSEWTHRIYRLTNREPQDPDVKRRGIQFRCKSCAEKFLADMASGIVGYAMIFCGSAAINWAAQEVAWPLLRWAEGRPGEEDE